MVLKSIMDIKKIVVTGGAGFIGSAVVRFIINNTKHQVINIDKITYAGNLSSLNSVADNPRYFFEKVDINNRSELKRIFNSFKTRYYHAFSCRVSRRSFNRLTR